MNWKNLSLFGREILSNDGFANLKEIIRTQNFGEPTEAYKGAVMHRQDPVKFKSAVSDFSTAYHTIADGLIAKSDALSGEDGRKAVELLKRCEILMGMSQTLSPVNEAFRHANVEKGKIYTGDRTAPWKVLEKALGADSGPERISVHVQHLQDHSFH